MDEGFRWAFKIINEMSGPSKEMSKDVKELKSQLKDAGVEIKKAEAAAKEAGGSFKELGLGFLKAFSVGEYISNPIEAIGAKVGELVRQVAEIGIEFGKSAVEAADFEDRSQIAFEALLGSAERAKDVIEEAKGFAFKSAQPLEATLQSYQQLLLAKVKPLDIPVILKGATDLAALSGGRTGLGELVQIFSQIASKGELTGRALATLSKSGLNVGDLAKRLGYKDFIDLQKGLQTSPIQAFEGIRAILRTLASQEGGALGKTTERMADTVGGSIQRIKTGWESLIGSISTEPEFAGFRTALGGIAQLFDSSTDEGKAFEKQINDVLSSGLELVTDLLGHKDDIAQLFAGALEVAKDFLAILHLIEAAWKPISFLSFPLLAARGAINAVEYFGDKTSTQKPEELTPEDYASNDQSAGKTLKYATGGYVEATGGGRQVTVGEGNEGEFILPESKLAGLLSRGAGSQASISFGGIHVTPKPGEDSQELAQRVRQIVASALEAALEGYKIEMGSS